MQAVQSEITTAEGGSGRSTAWAPSAFYSDDHATTGFMLGGSSVSLLVNVVSAPMAGKLGTDPGLSDLPAG